MWNRDLFWQVVSEGQIPIVIPVDMDGKDGLMLARYSPTGMDLAPNWRLRASSICQSAIYATDAATSRRDMVPLASQNRPL